MKEGWDQANRVDLAVAARQLGRALVGRVVAVAKRCSYGQPQVLVTYPLVHAADSRWAPFPTVFWLTCPHMRSGLAYLESRGMIEDVRCRIREDEAFRREYKEANKRYASQRTGLLDSSDRARLQMDAQTGGPGAGVLRVIEESGIGGAADWTGVKCLHMNVADSMAGNANPVGELCMQRLAEGGTVLECVGGRCVPVRVAAINAGSDSAKVLVADVVERPGSRCGLGSDLGFRRRQAFRVASASQITGLGRGLDRDGCLSEKGCRRTAESVRDFVAMARELGAQRIWVTATAAVRMAFEAGDDGGVEALRRKVREVAGVELEVISPELEAELSLEGVLAAIGSMDCACDPGRLVVVDSGGMSTEFIRMQADGVESVSLPIGAVSLMERFVKEDPPGPGEMEAMRAYIHDRMRGADSNTPGVPGRPGDQGALGVLVAVGGTAATLVSISLGLESFDGFDHDRASGVVMSRDEIEHMLARLIALPCAERSRIRGMIQPERALVMPAGTAIILGAMDVAGVDRAVMSFAGILDGMAARLGRLR